MSDRLVMWVCMSISPGRMVFPARSIRRAPAGAARAPAVPTAVTLSSTITTAGSATTLPATGSTIRAAVM